jgi:hypothetical protein
VGRSTRQFGEGHDPLGHRWDDGLNLRGPGLIAQQVIDAVLGKLLVSASDSRFDLGSTVHDRHRAEGVGGDQ